jgi:DNA-binding CsgD family transcriptional regulator
MQEEMIKDTKTGFIHDLWDELADFDAACCDEALIHLMGNLCALADACNVTWLGVARLDTAFPDDRTKGWRARICVQHQSSPQWNALAWKKDEMQEQGIVDEAIIHNMDGAGCFRANRIRDLVGSEWFESSPCYRDYYQDIGHEDAVWVAFPVSEDTESWFGIFRSRNQPSFTVAERDVIAYALRGIKRLHRQLVLSYGLLAAVSPLTPAERRVLHPLLTGLAEKCIAQNLGQSYHTTHGCISAIYRKFGVNNRAALMALWLGGAA